MASALRLYGVLAGLMLAAVAPATWLAFRYWSTASGNIPSMQLELFKGLAQFVSVGFVGGIAAETFRGINEKRAASAALSNANTMQHARDFEFVRSVSYDILDTYNEIKLVRRMLRAASELDDSTCRVPDTEYRVLCLRLESAQIALERLKKLVRSSQERFVVAGGTETFFAKLVRSEDYIRNILREFEDHKHSLEQDVRVIDCHSLTYGFVAQKSALKRLNRAETAWDNFFKPMDELEDAVAVQSSFRSTAAAMP